MPDTLQIDSDGLLRVNEDGQVLLSTVAGTCCCGAGNGCLTCLEGPCPPDAEYCGAISVTVSGVTPILTVSDNSYNIEVDGSVNGTFCLDGVLVPPNDGTCGYATYMGTLATGRVILLGGTPDEEVTETEFVMIVNYFCSTVTGDTFVQAYIFSLASIAGGEPATLFSSFANDNELNPGIEFNPSTGEPPYAATYTDGECRKTTATAMPTMHYADSVPIESADHNQFGKGGTVSVTGCC